MWLNGGRRSYKAASRKIWDLLQPLINALGPPVEYPLDDLHEDDQEDHRHPHQRGNAAVMAVLNGNAAQASGTDHTGDGGIGQNRHYGDGTAQDQGGHGFRQIDLSDDLKGGGAHGLGSLHHAASTSREGTSPP